MTLVPSTAASAVYHDALTTARRFRTLCALVLALVLLAQVGLFFAEKYWADFPRGDESGGVELADGLDPNVSSTETLELEGDGDVETDTEYSADPEVTTTTVSNDVLADWGYMAVYATLWLGLVFSILLALTLGFIVLVMLNGRTVGVPQVTRAFTKSLLLLVLFIPWQAVLMHPTIRGGAFHVPGVLYTWMELLGTGHYSEYERANWLMWVRFVAWPAVAFVLLLIVTFGSGKGIKQALGEDLPDLDGDGRPG